MEEKPTFEHPQPQSNQPIAGQVYSATPSLQDVGKDIDDLKESLDMQIKTHIHDGNSATRINFNTDIIGLIETVTVAPTIVPKSVFDQLKIATIAGTTYLYAYDTNSNSWKRVTIA